MEYSSDTANARIDFVSESCVRVAIYKNKQQLLPTFCINPKGYFSENGRARLSTADFELCSPKINTGGGKHCFELPCGVKIELYTENFLLKYYKGENLLFSDRKPLAYNFENEFGSGSFHYVSRAAGERIFGLGDKSGAIDKSGRAFRIETTDCMGYNAAQSDPLYKHIPFYICENSVGAYGIFYDTSDAAYVDLGCEINNYYEPYKYFKTEDNCLVYYVFFGTKLSVLQQFCAICGRQPLPPEWSFDYCASTMAYTDAPESQKKMHDFSELLKEHDLSCGGFYLSSGYTSIGSRRYVFNWNTDKFPNPKAFISDFAAMGIEIIPNIKPAFLVDHPLYSYISKNGWFIKNADGSPFITEFWDGLGSYLDFTNGAAFDFWKSMVTKKLLDYGITATWNDNNEFDIKDSGAVAAGFNSKQVSAQRIRPVFTYLMVAASYRAQIEKRPEIRPFLSSRSGSIAIRRFAQTWSGDNRTEFSDLRCCHNIGLTMSLSGLYFYGHDLGGFSGPKPSRELLLRWLQHGIFEPRFTIHSWNSDGSATMPWTYRDILPAVRKLFAKRKQLVPYIYSCAYNAVQNEIPMNAPLFLYYDDEELYSSTDSMLLGTDILAAFVFDSGVNKASVFLPRGTQWHLNGRVYQGGQTIELNIAPAGDMPYFVRAGCVLPTDESPYGFKSQKKIVFTVYPPAAGEFESEFFCDDGKSFRYLENICVKLKFKVLCTGAKVSVSFKNYGQMPFEPELRLCPGDGRQLEITPWAN
ncbi:MAG: hypothetical protein LUH82_07260 [Clostridiales bacterium]|nr:hypothetical protein [Clostridiales bacterium]